LRGGWGCCCTGFILKSPFITSLFLGRCAARCRFSIKGVHAAVLLGRGDCRSESCGEAEWSRTEWLSEIGKFGARLRAAGLQLISRAVASTRVSVCVWFEAHAVITQSIRRGERYAGQGGPRAPSSGCGCTARTATDADTASNGERSRRGKQKKINLFLKKKNETSARRS